MDQDILSHNPNSSNAKPVPLPRKNLIKSQPQKSNNEEIYANAVTMGKLETTCLENNVRRTKDKLLRNEVQKLEKSFRKIIPKRRSIAPKENDVKIGMPSRCSSLPESQCSDIFNTISFKSPINDGSHSQQRCSFANNGSDDSTDESDTESFYTTSDEPPPYPPPPLPDESTYDELTSASSEGPNSYYSPGSDTASIYEELTSYLSASKNSSNDRTLSEVSSSASGSWKFYDTTNTDGPRYEVIPEKAHKESPILVPEKTSPIDLINEQRHSKSESVPGNLVLQFDPLFSGTESVTKPHRFNPFDDPDILAFLASEPDSPPKSSNKHSSILSDCEHLNFEIPSVTGPPPVPPRRYDSVSAVDTIPETAQEAAKLPKDPQKRTSIIRWSSMKRVARLVADNIESSGIGRRKGSIRKSLSEENVVNEMAESSRSSVYSNNEEEVYIPLVLNHNGVLYRSGGLKRWGVLAQRKLTIFSGKDSPDVKETIAIDTVLSLRVCQDNKICVEGEQVSCFEVSLSGKSQPILLGTPSPSERHVWMRKILESITPAFPARLALDYSKAGRCYFKEGISSRWALSSVLLSQRSLHLVPTNGSLITADLRKARFITLQESDLTCEKALEKGPLLLVDLQDRTFYLQMDSVPETTAWEGAVRAAALQNGPALSQQQLTKDDVPTVVDKCINFVHTHGSATEGIYRRNGSSSAIGKLLSAFRKDAWSVQLTRQEFSEFDVSSVLKRFFRDLPEPIFVPEIHQPLRSIIEDSSLLLFNKLQRYREVLKLLPHLNFLTARRLMGHLYFIDKLHTKNLMPVENLAAIWGPTLMHVQEGTSLDPNWSRVESTVINDLITNYPALFDVSEVELQRERKILSMLENFHSNTTGSQVGKKPSGDLKVWVYLNTQEGGDCVSVALPPGKTAGDVCDELSNKMSLPGHSLCIQEVVSGGQLRRPLHYSECVLEAVLRWGSWPEQDRRDNCLVLTPATILEELVPLISIPLLPAVEEFKFADPKTKNFKPFLFELSQTCLCYYKDKTCSVKLKEWKLSDVVWYIGFEKKRNPHSGWAITFITKEEPPTRAKDRPFFGNTICGSTEQQRRKWMAALLLAAHPRGILPLPLLIE